VNLFSFLLLIVIAGLAYDVIRQRNRARDELHTGERAFDEARERELQREVEELRERIKVLERIATEPNDTAKLSAEIERLRDQ
jgi:hypothetical protein